MYISHNADMAVLLHCDLMPLHRSKNWSTVAKPMKTQYSHSPLAPVSDTTYIACGLVAWRPRPRWCIIPNGRREKSDTTLPVLVKNMLQRCETIRTMQLKRADMKDIMNCRRFSINFPAVITTALPSTATMERGATSAVCECGHVWWRVIFISPPSYIKSIYWNQTQRRRFKLVRRNVSIDQVIDVCSLPLPLSPLPPYISMVHPA